DVATLVATCDRVVRSTHKQRRTAHGHRLCPNYTHRIARHHSPSARRTRGSGETASEFACAWPKRTRDVSAKKLTRPDGEIRAGRVDRRRGSGGRERRSGLEFRPCRPVRLLVSASGQKVQADSWGSGGNFLPPLAGQQLRSRRENTSDFRLLLARSRNGFGRGPGWSRA